MFFRHRGEILKVIFYFFILLKFCFLSRCLVEPKSIPPLPFSTEDFFDAKNVAINDVSDTDAGEGRLYTTTLVVNNSTVIRDLFY
jgi:hypothetical protein